MASAGIVRRIDELGRIVIPKELRRTMRLNEGDEMEICVDGDNITLRKHSGFESVRALVRAVSGLLAKATDSDVLFVTAQSVEVADGKNKRLYAGRKLSDKFAEDMRRRKPDILHGDALREIFAEGECSCCYVVEEPVIVGGDLIGAALMLLDSLPSDISRAYLHFCVEMIEASLG